MSIIDINEAVNHINEASDPDANIIFGAGIDESLEDEVRITVIATGFEKPTEQELKPNSDELAAPGEDKPAPAEEPSPEQAEILKQLRGEPARPVADEEPKIPTFVRTPARAPKTDTFAPQPRDDRDSYPRDTRPDYTRDESDYGRDYRSAPQPRYTDNAPIFHDDAEDSGYRRDSAGDGNRRGYNNDVPAFLRKSQNRK